MQRQPRYVNVSTRLRTSEVTANTQDIQNLVFDSILKPARAVATSQSVSV